jgi:hypothetical protein
MEVFCRSWIYWARRSTGRPCIDYCLLDEFNPMEQHLRADTWSHETDTMSIRHLEEQGAQEYAVLDDISCFEFYQACLYYFSLSSSFLASAETSNTLKLGSVIQLDKSTPGLNRVVRITYVPHMKSRIRFKSSPAWEPMHPQLQDWKR